LKSNQFKLSLVLLLGFYLYGYASDNQSPFNKEELALSAESVRTIRFLKSTRVEIEFQGKLKNSLELSVDGDKVPVRQGQFKATVNLYPLKEIYHFKIKRPGISESVYPLKIRFVKDLPLPLRVKIEASQTKPISKEKVFTGTFPSRDWIQMTWLEATEKLDPAYLEKMEEEKQKLARLEEERVLNEKADQERALKLKEEAAFVEQERMRGMQEKERLEELEKEKLEAERVAKEQEAERLAEEKLEKERELASQLEKSNEMIEQRQYREPTGLSLNQGLSSFSLKQTQADLSSLNWMLRLSYQTKLNERMKIGGYGQSYLVPLSVTGAAKGPNVIKVGADLGYEFKDASGGEWTPTIGFGYQTMATSESIGYRDLFGPKVGVSLKLPMGQMQFLASSLGMSVFPTSEQLLSFGNNEFHFKTALEWKVSSSFLSSLYLGVEFSTLNLLISGAKLTSSGYSVFFGVNF
jgi:hypothetical protein